MIAYLANEFPCAVEPYVEDEVHELRRHGLQVLTCSVKQPGNVHGNAAQIHTEDILYLYPLRLNLIVLSLFALCRRDALKILYRVMAKEKEGPGRRLRALVHTYLGAYYSVLLKDRPVEHIHVHHGYFASWIAMVAAHLLGISYSITLHGSDLLIHAAYLDIKLENCKTCFTVSDFNRGFILEHYPQIAPGKIVVSRIGVALPPLEVVPRRSASPLRMLSVGRLHAVKDHAFLIHACRALKDRGCQFTCQIVGDGPERNTLARMIEEFGLANEISLAGHLPHEELDPCYASADLVVLTSRSEGIPLVLMEAMARKKLVLAPAITGVPELVVHGETGFLYSPGSIRDFVHSVESVIRSFGELDSVRRSARAYVSRKFNREKTLATFAELFIAQLPASREVQDENFILQQV
ncbi:MAG TPA: glycosyltransferase family 4 protein [Terriglobales bacterium]|nr:glycosyltransferase family 4 protein [Terriglobales bacterium]